MSSNWFTAIIVGNYYYNKSPLVSHIRSDVFPPLISVVAELPDNIQKRVIYRRRGHSKIYLRKLKNQAEEEQL